MYISVNGVVADFFFHLFDEPVVLFVILLLSS